MINKVATKMKSSMSIVLEGGGGGGQDNSTTAQIDLLNQRIDDLEMYKIELENEIDTSKIKARGLLMKKELNERRIKIIIQKLESHLKGTVGLGQDEINKIAQLNDDEVEQLYDEERKIESEINQELEDLVPEELSSPDCLKLQKVSESDASVLGHLDKQIASQSTKREVKAQAQALSED